MSSGPGCGCAATSQPATVAEVKPPSLERRRVPKDGPGPHGAPECYYTSRVLNSTGRYARFVKRLRASEEVLAQQGAARKQQEAASLSQDFFNRCHRRALISTVEHRVELCLESYEDDLNAKRARLKEMLTREEEDDIRKFVIQAQAGADMVWQEKRERLAFLLAKRKKEHDEKYKATPLSKITGVAELLFKARAKEAQQIQLYQMKEKLARKESQRELDAMWRDVALKESEALDARMELDAMLRKRRDVECRAHSDHIVALNIANREKDRERLKQEVLWLHGVWAAENKKDQDAQRQVIENRLEATRVTKQILDEQKAGKAEKAEEDRLVRETWADLCRAGLDQDRAAEELRRTKEKELVLCNRKLHEMQCELASLDIANEGIIQDVVRKNREAADRISCEYVNKVRKNDKDCRETMLKDIEEHKKKREELRKKMLEEEEYNRQLHKQIEELMTEKERADAEKRKKQQADLLQQIQYNALLKERALAEEVEQVKKYKLATEQYKEVLKETLNRPFFSDHVHPFMRQMAKGLKMPEKCPCSKPDHCK